MSHLLERVSAIASNNCRILAGNRLDTGSSNLSVQEINKIARKGKNVCREMGWLWIRDRDANTTMPP
jgi:hypothetical protein